MKLVLANNQTKKFTEFYQSINELSNDTIHYRGYNNLLFKFGFLNKPIKLINVLNNRDISDYKAVYINGYLKNPELAYAVAITCQALRVPFINSELNNPPSLTKLTMYLKLAAANVAIPPTIAGTKKAVLHYLSNTTSFFPVVLKKADSERGKYNYYVSSPEVLKELLSEHEKTSLWIAQAMVKNKGFYRLETYNYKPKLCIYRSLEKRPDNNPLKRHIYKPRGGANARLIKLNALPNELKLLAEKSCRALNRQIAGVDCLQDEVTKRFLVLEVNYNPQLVTIETFKNLRINAYVNFLNNLG